MLGLHMYNEVEKLQREMDQLFSGSGLIPRSESQVATARFKVQDVGDRYQVHAALPGIDVDKLEVNVLGRQLSLAAEMREEDPGEQVVWHRRERGKGVFRKTFTVPDEIDAAQVEAEYRNGILAISLPKAAAVLPKKISVKAA